MMYVTPQVIRIKKRCGGGGGGEQRGLSSGKLFIGKRWLRYQLSVTDWLEDG